MPIRRASICNVCYNTCGILVESEGDDILKIEGNPNSPIGRGKLCPKGLSAPALHKAPSRLNYPLIRTNPEKGIGIDPKWRRASWDEALDLITERLKEVRSKDPRSLLIIRSVVHANTRAAIFAFAKAFGTPNMWTSGAGSHCGNAEHMLCGTLHSSWFKMPDFNYCKYLMVFGTNLGSGGYYDLTTLASKLGDARLRGMKLVVIDPMMNAIAAKADEWLPIRPGTDGMLALAMLNLLLNEFDGYDEEYLREHTNAPYLIEEGGLYLRESGSGKPLIWDAADGRAKPYDDPTLKRPAILGEYEIKGRLYRPSFQVLKEHLRKYELGWASEVTTLPAETIRRVAQEYLEAASLGSSLEIEGRSLPLRPAVAIYFKGAQGHKHATLTAMAIELLNEVIGNAETPGGALGENGVCFGYPSTGRPSWSPSKGPDGLMSTGAWPYPSKPYPPMEPRRPTTLGLREVFPLSTGSVGVPLTLLEPERYGLNYKAEAALIYGCNAVMTSGNPEMVAEGLKRLSFIAAFNIMVDETSELADVVLPDAWYLERLGTPFAPSEATWHNSLPGLGEEWCYAIQQPVVAPAYERRNGIEVLLELAERLGILREMYEAFNQVYGLEGEHALEGTKRYTWEEIVDRVLRFYFGDDKGLEWFKEHGVIKWPKRKEEVYWKRFQDYGRVPIYFEHFKRVGEKVELVKRELGLEDLDTSDYQPLPDWKPCPSYLREDYDLYAIYYRSVLHTFQYTIENPLLDQLAERRRLYLVALNPQAAARRGIKEGDVVEIESAESGQRVLGVVRLTETVHPEVLGIAGIGGHWSKSLKRGSRKGKGVCMEWLLPISLKNMDGPSGNYDLCAKVRIRKLETEPLTLGSGTVSAKGRSSI